MGAPRIIWHGLERAILSPGARNGMSVLIFHRVRKEKDPLRPNEPSQSEFDGMLAFLASRFRMVRLYDGVSALKEASRPYHSVAITFDDGYADNLEVALPTLRKYGVPATFFVASGLLDGGVMWNDRVIEAIRTAPGPILDLTALDLGSLPLGSDTERRQAIRAVIPALKYRADAERVDASLKIAEAAGVGGEPNLMMSSEQLAILAADPLADIGGHTVTHPILKNLAPSAAFGEIAAGKERLEQITGRTLKCFAYPNGVPNRDYGAEHTSMAQKAGFEYAVSTSPGGVTTRSDRLQLPRFTPWDRQWSRFGLRMLMTARNPGAVAIATD